MIEVSAVRMARSRRVCGSDAVWVRDGSRRVSKAPEPVGREAIGNRVRVRSGISLSKKSSFYVTVHRFSSESVYYGSAIATPIDG